MKNTNNDNLLFIRLFIFKKWFSLKLIFVSFQEEELEDARAATQKKVKALEQQLENEHEERINFVREKHELETKIINLQEMASRSADEEQVSKLKKDLKRTKALLKDAQLMIERSKSDSSNKVVMRQLKNQVSWQ
jgi:myosin-18